MFLLFLAAFFGADAAKLPSFSAAHHDHKDKISHLDRSGMWWAHVGDEVYHQPSSLLGLSSHVSDYYFAQGSHKALTPEMEAHRVGGHGRWHIFHLPDGKAALGSIPTGGDRRASFSSLVQLSSGVVLSDAFPVYKPKTSCVADSTSQQSSSLVSTTKTCYQSPLSVAGQAAEKTTVGHISADQAMGFLKEITTLGSTAATPTRSWTNPEAQDHAQQFLQKKFKGMGLTTCLSHFAQEQSNVIGFMAGSSSDTVTVGAHYDSRPFDGKAPGAEDNGSGLAAMLAIAEAFTKAGVKPVKSVYFVGFAGEEAGLLGSHDFTAKLKASNLPAGCGKSASFLQTGKQGEATHSAIVMDEVGWKSPKMAKPTVNLEAYDWAQSTLEHLAQASTMHNGESLEIVHSGNPFGSDHMSFLELKMEAVLTINGDDEAYPNYHQSTDTIDNVNAEYMAMIAKMNGGALVRMAGVQ